VSRIFYGKFQKRMDGYYYAAYKDFSASVGDPYAAGLGFKFAIAPTFGLEVGAQYKNHPRGERRCALGGSALRLPISTSVSLSATETLKAIAYESGWTNSSVIAATYKLQIPHSIIVAYFHYARDRGQPEP